MKIKELNSSANIAWSPKHMAPLYLACGTSSHQIDASFASPAQLSLYDLSKQMSSLDMTLISATAVPAKFNNLLWKENSSHPSGIIVGGCDDGSVYLYSASKLMKNQDPLIIEMKGKHAGPVFTLDFNYHQENLLATGSRECEILIWDITDPSSPMTPGAKPNIIADVTGLAWNRQVEHIMASTYAGRCVVYDLRKSTSIIQISESVSGIKTHNISWHPNVATQLILGCDDDSTPVAQVWDLRFAAAPLKTIDGHQRGIVATEWCTSDADLFITSAKDNKIYVWNPNNNDKSAEFVGEFPSYNQWSFDISWCQKDPSLVATSSVDGTVSVYSVLGGGIAPAQANKFSAIADSFPGMELPTEVPQVIQPRSIYLKYPPKWFPKRSGVSFGFGGRLLSWGVDNRFVTISQVVTEDDLVQKSCQLEEALSQANLMAYCENKAETSTAQHGKMLWNFISATFDPDFKNKYRSLFGFTIDQVSRKVRSEDFVTDQNIVDKMSNLTANSQNGSNSSLDPSEQFEIIASVQSVDKENEDNNLDLDGAPVSEAVNLSVGEDPEGLLRHALLIGDYKSAIKLCLQLKKCSLGLILAAHAGPEHFKQTRDKVLSMESHSGLSPLVVSVVQQDLYAIVSRCNISDWKEALVASLTYASDEHFSSMAECLGDRLEAEGTTENLQAALICFLCAGHLDKFVSCWVKTMPVSDKPNSYLQELVEVLVVLQRGLSSIGRPASLNEGSSASVYLCQYASLLASQGALQTAVSYLNSATQGEMVELRNRIYRALGFKTGSGMGNSMITGRIRSTSTSSHHSYGRSTTPFNYQAQPASIPNPVYGGMATPMPPVNQFGQNVMQQPLSQPPAPPMAKGPPMGNFRRSDASSRYVGGANPPSNISKQPPSMFNPMPVNPLSQPMMSGTMNPISQTMMHGTVNPISQPMMPGTGNPLSQPAMPPSHPETSSVPYPHASSSFMPEPSQHESSTLTPAAFDPSVPRGWNDPPPLSASRKAKQQQKTQQPESTGAIPGMMVPEPPKLPLAIHNYQGQFSGQPGNFQNVHQQPPPETKSPEPVVPKGPLPVRHQIIQDTFNRLREKGIQVTANPTAKQRLEDLAVKLEILYDKLRSDQVSANTAAGLHQIVAAIQAGDYHRALQHHSATISSGNFSEMSQFMPAIKLLLTTCMQCQVFLH